MKKTQIITYNRNQSFWDDAPTTPVISYLKSYIPFTPNKEPFIIYNQNLDTKYNENEEDTLYKDNKSYEYYSLRKVNFERTFEYINFISDHFYKENLEVKKTYSLLYLIENIKNNNIYGVEIRDDETKKLVGIVLARNLGLLNFNQYRQSNISACLVTELCLHPSYKKRGLTNLLMRRLYKYSVQRGIYVHLFQIDSINAPLIFPLNKTIVYGRQNSGKKIDIEKYNINEIPLTIEFISKIKRYYYLQNPNSIIACSNPLGVHVWQSNCATIVLRDLDEFKGDKEGAELIYAEVYQKENKLEHINTILDSTRYDWFETSLDDLKWKAKGLTISFAAHLNSGSPSLRPFIYI